MTSTKRVPAALFVLLALATLGSAQSSKRAAHIRTVRGFVSDKDGNPAAAAIIFLKNMRTQAIESRITDESGNYHFNGINPNADYEIHAEKDGTRSATRRVSSLDTRNQIIINLKLDPKGS
ncbi:MAG TPA: carboxypeptidase-like regulatory domain-containing protein [Candidatus Acidoferrales bacterium]|nr:carboxypeptidase-like regulatory domain-containing protein [Candidatus Acidoferrales bacterium]